MLSQSSTINETKDCIAHLEKWNAKIPCETAFAVGPGKSYVQPEPLGVVLIIGAWNYPVPLSVMYAAQAIAGGNCVLIKTSELSPYSSNAIADLFETYMDKDCFRVVEGQVQVAIAITKLPFDKIVFTGSTEKGKLVAKAAAENLVPCILELGGKSPTIVDNDADVRNAALRIVQGRFSNAGQTCVACDYVFIHKDLKDTLVEAMKNTVLTFYGEDASQSPDYGRIINEFHCNRLKDYLNENHGGKVVIGGTVKVGDRYVAPTIVDSPKMDSKMMLDEIFGPILPVFEFTDINKVIDYINSKPKPLALYYYGKQHWELLKKRTSSGAIVQNESIMHFANLDLPFGGVGYSGMGSVHGHEGFKQLIHMKPVFEKGTMNGTIFSVRFPPFTNSKKSAMRNMFKHGTLRQSTVYKGLGLMVFLTVAFVVYRTGHLETLKKIFLGLFTGGKGSAKKDL
jgi:aldehyde dehydrogenase (NAD+)